MKEYFFKVDLNANVINIFFSHLIKSPAGCWLPVTEFELSKRI